MKLEKPSLQRSGILVSFVAAFWATACGGSAFTGDANAGAGGASLVCGPACPADGGAGGAGATSGSAGSATAGSGGAIALCNGAAACPLIACAGVLVSKPGQCCPVCESGGAGGSLGIGGADGCGPTACGNIACAPGWSPVYAPGACCPTCVYEGGGGASGSSGASGAGGGTGCGGVACPAIACASGFMLSQQPGDCCGTCVPDDTCTQGQQGYEVLQGQLITQPGAVACKVDRDCAFIPGNAYCGTECAAVPVNAVALQSISEELSKYAGQNCSSCTPVYPPCAAPLPPICNQGQCVAGTYL